ncbi:MAG: GGDEF domain-containing phosphodiesterase [Lachnospiraceae bacterium]|nr:GGDEF domain-containing phosphodiesterase [Lachnospiraceae bacterium]
MTKRTDHDSIPEMFAKNLAGGTFIYRADPEHSLVYADEGMVRLFECDDYEDFVELVGNSFDGIVSESQSDTVIREIDFQLEESQNRSGYVFYHIQTKHGNIRRVVNHWTLVHDSSEGDLFYACIFLHKTDNVGSDFDSTTGLYGKRKLTRHVAAVSRRLGDKSSGDYAIIYVNLVNFKLLNIEKGVTAGDDCLTIISDILRRCYKKAYISRISGDHFAVFSGYENLVQKSEEVRKQFFDAYGGENHVVLKFGIYHFPLLPNFDIEFALSQAKIACDHIKYDSKTDVIEYSDNLIKEIKTGQHVVRKIDEAIEKGWIRVYFQPVIRSLTGCLCGMESLARWIDPEFGFLNPNQFIGILEQERCIHKLDCFIVQEVCKSIHERLEAELPMVPVSVNFSRLDFVMCDMLSVVGAAVKKYDVPRDCLHIEVTESMISSDKEMMRGVINSFRKAGYEVWMDDFGSGYSSLNLLKDYQFDTLKLDMNFLYPFTEKSRNIVRSTVTMAKEIGMKTLTEGVETKEHLDFLREIGCEMIQGYYYGRPEPLDEVFRQLEEKGIQIETRSQRYFYEVAGFHARATDTPLEIIEDDNGSFRTLFMNRKYQEQIFEEASGLDIEEIDRRIYHTESPLIHKYREFADQLESTDRPERFYYTANGNYYCFEGQTLVNTGEKHIIKGSIINLTKDQWKNEKERLDSKLHELNLLFEAVLLVNIRSMTLSPLLGSFLFTKTDPDSHISLSEGQQHILERVHPEDCDLFRAFIDGNTLYDRIVRSEKGYVNEAFRLRSEDGGYCWKEAYLMLIPGTGGKEYLYCLKSLNESIFERSRQ